MHDMPHVHHRILSDTEEQEGAKTEHMKRETNVLIWEAVLSSI